MVYTTLIMCYRYTCVYHCIHVCVFVRVCVCLSVCLSVSVCLSMCVHIHVVGLIYACIIYDAFVFISI